MVHDATRAQHISPDRCGDFKSVSEQMLWIKFVDTSCEIAIRRTPQNTFHDKLTLVRVMVWCRQAPEPVLAQIHLAMWRYFPLNTWRNNNVVITSKRRHFDAITSKWRRFDVITTWLLCNVSAGLAIMGWQEPFPVKMYRSQFKSEEKIVLTQFPSCNSDVPIVAHLQMSDNLVGVTCI